MPKFTPTIEQVSADARGEIYSIALPGNKELMLLHSVAGSLRGGHAHDCGEVITLLTGAVHYDKREQDGSAWTEEMGPGDARFVPQGVYHLAEFTEDSWLLEWKLTKDKTTWRNLDHKPWREKVAANTAGK